MLGPLYNYQNNIAQGDHGRDYYCYAATLKGQVPYQDYWWVYGPLMPYYYAFFLKILGLSIPSILIGEIMLKLTAGLFIYRTLRILARPFWGMLAALWFWNFYPYFFFTYNHTGGITLITAIIFFLVQYLFHNKPSALYKGLFGIFLLSFVKLNMGLCSLFSFTLSVGITDLIHRRKFSDKKLFYLLAGVILPLAVAFFYHLFFKGLPFYVIRQSFPFLGSDRQFSLPASMAAKVYKTHLIKEITKTWFSKLFFSLLSIAAISTVLHTFQKKKNKTVSPYVYTAILILGLFSITHLHEYLFSGVQYRLFWASPFHIIFMFTLFSLLATYSSRYFRWFLYLFFSVFLGLTSIRKDVGELKASGRFWSHPRAQIYFQNSPQWINTVEQTAAYLQKHLQPEETFFVFPYDPLYYLTDRIAPTRQLMLFYNNHIPVEQEIETIQDLQEQRVRFVVLSNRVNTGESRLGYFGRTHCRLLAQYFIDNFEQVAAFGDWKTPAQWVEHHGTIIIKRKF